MVGVARRGHGAEELIEAGNPANILGRGTTGAIHEARVVKRRVGGGDILVTAGTSERGETSRKSSAISKRALF